MYLDLDEFLAAKLPEVKKDSEKTAVESVIKAASAFVDKTTSKSFAAAGADPSTRRFRGDGTKILRIPAHIKGTATVENVSVKSFYEHEISGWLYKISGTSGEVESFAPSFDGYPLWTKNALYNVSARWGYAAVPEDIREAVSQITVRWWKAQQGTLGQITPGGFVIERDVDPSTRSILANWTRQEFELV